MATKDTDKILFKNKWVTVKETDNEYVYTEGCRGVVIIPIKEIDNNLKVLLRKEKNPIISDLITLITGRSDNDEEPIETAIRELEEEAGISGITVDDCSDLGELFLGKDRPLPDTIFLINVTEGIFNKPIGDGSTEEAQSKNFWIDAHEIAEYLLKYKDSYLLSGLGKLLALINSVNKDKEK